MKNLLPLGFLALAACASTSGVMSEAPIEVINSAKSQTDVAFCLAAKWDAAALDHASGAKVIVVKNGSGSTAATLSVYAAGDGSRTEIRKGVAPFGFRRFRDCY